MFHEQVQKVWEIIIMGGKKSLLIELSSSRQKCTGIPRLLCFILLRFTAAGFFTMRRQDPPPPPYCDTGFVMVWERTCNTSELCL